MLAHQLIEGLLRLPENVKIVVLDPLGQYADPKLLHTGSIAILQPRILADKASKDPLTLNAFQDYALAEAVYTGHGTGSVTSITITLTGLLGEGGKALHMWNDTLRGDAPLTDDIKQDLATAIGHALWYIAALSNELGLSLSALGARSIRQARQWRREREANERQASMLSTRNQQGE